MKHVVLKHNFAEKRSNGITLKYCQGIEKYYFNCINKKEIDIDKCNNIKNKLFTCYKIFL